MGALHPCQMPHEPVHGGPEKEGDVKYCTWIAVFLCLMFVSPPAQGAKETSPVMKPIILSPQKPATVKNNTSKPTFSHPANSAKINAFLAKINNAKSLKDLENAFKNARFTDSELRQMEKEFNKGHYKSKMNSLKQKANRQSKTDPRLKAKPKKIDVRKLKGDLKKNQDMKITRLNKSAKSMTARLSRTTRVATSSRAASLHSASAARVPVPTVIASGIPVPTSSVHITELNPEVGIIGQRMTISGSGFGTTRGEVSVTVGPRGSSNRQAFSCPIQSWNDRRIVITIPLDCESMVELREQRFGIGSEFAWIYINPAGDDPGAFENTEVFIDRERFAPEIDALSSNNISPGQLLVIEGRNFNLAGTRPQVRFEFGHERIDVDADRFADNYIEVRLPDNIEGLYETPGRLEVTNLTSLKATRNITFVPAEEIVEMVSETMRATCVTRRPWIFCLAGQTYRHTLHESTLRNDWVVEDSWLETHPDGINAGAYYLHEPTRGSAVATSRIEVWADAYSSANCKEHLFLKGPKGTFRQSNFTP